MTKDFTIGEYRALLFALLEEGYSFQTYQEFVENPLDKVIVLRHDVDAKPLNSLRFAQMLACLGISGTYYFRVSKNGFDEFIIKQITQLGHEVGYHYETMDTCNGHVDKAYEEFCINLEKIKKIATINTITMHGSPLSAYDNKDIWKKYNYKSLGIIAEPYFDLNFDKVFYITDTGRRWDGGLYNVRDKAVKENPITNPDFLKLKFRFTSEIIQSVKSGLFPSKAMLNFHPQRWTNIPLQWRKELIFQKIKNVGKYALIKMRGEQEEE